MAIEKRPVKYHYYAVSPCVLSFLDSGNLRLNAGSPFSLTPPQAEVANNSNHPKKNKYRLVDVDYEEVVVPDKAPPEKSQPPDPNLQGSKKDSKKEQTKASSKTDTADSKKSKDEEKHENRKLTYLEKVAGAKSVNELILVLSEVLTKEAMTEEIQTAALDKYPNSSRLKNFFSTPKKK